jgi:putative FmdB family regulatory protein
LRQFEHKSIAIKNCKSVGKLPLQPLLGAIMPTYDFKCEQCQTTFELNLSFENKDLQYCEDCEKPLVRIYTPVGAIFKGTGWGKQ